MGRKKKQKVCPGCESTRDFISLVMDYAASQNDDVLTGLTVDFFGVEKVNESVDSISDVYLETLKGRETWIIDTVNVDLIDVTGLDGREASVLALKLSKWNGKGLVYRYRDGKRYLAKRIRSLDMNDPFIQNLDSYPDLLKAIKGNEEVSHIRY